MYTPLESKVLNTFKMVCYTSPRLRFQGFLKAYVTRCTCLVQVFLLLRNSILLVSKSHAGDVTVSVNPGPGPDADFTVPLGHPGLRRALLLNVL